MLNKMNLEENIADDELHNEVKKRMLNSIGYVVYKHTIYQLLKCQTF